jgi:hypothetical protein
MPYADPVAETILVICFDPASLSRRFVWLPHTGDRAAAAANGPPALQDGSGHGAYWWDAANTTLTLKLVGAGTLEVRAEPAAMVGCCAGEVMNSRCRCGAGSEQSVPSAHRTQSY